jgi:hypothetical protein
MKGVVITIATLEVINSVPSIEASVTELNDINTITVDILKSEKS